MIDYLNKTVKCFLRNGMSLEGTVETWSDNIVILKSPENNLLILHKPEEDILLTIILQNSILKESSINEKKEEIKEKLQEVIQSDIDSEMNKLNLKQLRNLVIQQEQKIIKDKIQEHFGSSNVQAKYSTPDSLFKK